MVGKSFSTTNTGKPSQAVRGLPYRTKGYHHVLTGNSRHRRCGGSTVSSLLSLRVLTITWFLLVLLWMGIMTHYMFMTVTTTSTATGALVPTSHQFSNASFYYNRESAEELLSKLPPWIQNYVRWHSKIRQQFPGMELFTHPQAPPILLRTCLGVCGGLHDRLGQLPWDLYLANATGRILLLAWQRPNPLEAFLIPNHPQMFDWTVPLEFHTGFDDMHRVRNFTELFQDMPEAHPTEEFWNLHIDRALDRATHGDFRHIKVLRHRLLGHLGEQPLQDRLDRTSSSSSSSVHSAPHFGRIFWLFFRPSPPVEQWMNDIMVQGQLIPQQYTAVHCRVRHPKAISSTQRFVGKNPKYPADKTGLPWNGPAKDFALQVAYDALQCSSTILTDKPSPRSATTILKHPIYFLSDSNDLVNHIVSELNPQLHPIVLSHNNQSDMTSSGIHRDLYQLVQSLTIKARDVSLETAHLDLQKGRPPSAYYATFVDLLLVIHAHCVIYGVGYYASFGAKLSGTTCQYLYQQEAWGHQAPKLAQPCPTTHSK